MDGEQVRNYAIFHPHPVSLTPTLYLTQYVKNMTGETDMTDITTKDD